MKFQECIGKIILFSKHGNDATVHEAKLLNMSRMGMMKIQWPDGRIEWVNHYLYHLVDVVEP